MVIWWKQKIDVEKLLCLKNNLMLIYLITILFSFSFILTPILGFYSMKISRYIYDNYQLEYKEYQNIFGFISVKKIPFSFRSGDIDEISILKKIKIYNFLGLFWTLFLILVIVLFFTNILM